MIEVTPQLPRIHSNHWIQLKKENASKENNVKQKTNVSSRTYVEYFTNPIFAILGEKSSESSLSR
jgi:hypothetical protein